MFIIITFRRKEPSSHRKTKIEVTDEIKIESQESFSYKVKPNRVPRSKQSILINKTRRKVEDKMAKMFMWIVIIFIACHLPRLDIKLIRKNKYNDKLKIGCNIVYISIFYDLLLGLF